MKSLAFAIALAAAACGPGSPGGPTMGNRLGGGNATAQSSDVASAEILSREPVSNTAIVKHILISWKDLEDAFSGHQDPRAQKRTKAEAEALVKSLVGQLKGGADFESLMKANSEDVGSAQTNRPFTVTPDAQLVIEFRQLSLRLEVGEYGVVQSDFGFHIIKRYPN